MNIVIVPSHNQAENIDKIIAGYDKQTVPPDLLIFVLDRCTDNSREVFSRKQSKIRKVCLIKNSGDNFTAGATRDYGLSYVEENYPEYTNVIFTDGDCVPCEKLVEIHLDCLSQSSKPAVSCGMRIMVQQDGSEKQDERLDESWTNDYSFTDKNARLLISSRVTLESIFTYSCNFAFNKSAILLIKKINKQLSNKSRLFNPEFDGSWGGEDNFISDCLYRTGNNILLTSKECYVKHQWHKEADKSDIGKKRHIVIRLSERLKSLILKEQIPGEFSIFEKNRNILLPTKFIHQELSNIKKIVKAKSGLSIIDEIKYPFEIYGDDILTIKYMLSRNKITIAATEFNGPKYVEYTRTDFLTDFLTHIKIYLRNDSFEIDSSFKPMKSLNNIMRTQSWTI